MSRLADILYNLALAPAALALAPFFLADFKTKRAVTLRARLGLELPDIRPGAVWVHALSVGEVASAEPLLAELARQRAGQRLILSAATATGLAQARALVKAGLIEAAFQAPLDLLPAVNRILNRLQPRALIIVETDIWPNLLQGCRTRGAPTALVNFRISASRHRGHRLARPFFCSVYGRLAAVSLPSSLDLERFGLLGLADQVKTEVTGNLKYDRPPAPAEDRAGLGLAAGRPVILAGSTHEGEEEAVLAAWQSLERTNPDLALILAPRDANRFDKVAALVQARGPAPARLSRGEDFSSGRPILLADTFGRLAGLYGLAQVAFVGGSLVSQGGHNPLEAAALGVPVIFGPHMEDFPAEARALVAAGGAQQLADASGLRAALAQLLAEPDRAQTLGRAAQKVFEANQGAAARTVALLERAGVLGESDDR